MLSLIVLSVVATSVLGPLILNSGSVPGFPGLGSQPAILVWALAFGYGQQVVTRSVDQRADNLLSAASPLVPADRGIRAA
ncbi:hypothetical protein FHR32_003089 [Streptosporangium album]|uniref:Uncharacterized protein n=1 Tax=Streptosporangium album TaxID=47479 RepID=A0A7W7RV25_9ACTN|nr:hypothetical protein [Streptosporangium album]MBB4938784.1 hypothetical protein [Streptosporangium album]